MASMVLCPILRAHIATVERIRSSNAPSYLFVFISLNKCIVELSCSFTHNNISFPLGSLHSTSVEILFLHGAGREDSIFKLSLLGPKHIASVYFVLNVMWVGVLLGCAGRPPICLGARRNLQLSRNGMHLPCLSTVSVQSREGMRAQPWAGDCWEDFRRGAVPKGLMLYSM